MSTPDPSLFPLRMALALCIALLGAASGSVASDRESVFSLDGEWSFTKGNIRSADGYLNDPRLDEWKSIRVPSNWYNEGIDHSGVAWYRRSLPSRATRVFRRKASRGEAIAFLRFSAVDYAADVWLNEHYLGFHEGYFSSFKFDVSEVLHEDSRAMLAVRVNSPQEKAGPSWGLHKRLIKGVLSHHDTRPGGAWSHRGQEKNTGGIWESVSLEVARGVYLDDLKVVPKLAFTSQGDLQSAAIRVQSSALRWRGRSSARVLLRIYGPGSDHPIHEESLGRITRARAVIDRTVSIPDPALWWPWSRGEQPLYRAELVALEDSGDFLHSTSSRFGLRTIERVAESGVWKINGRRLFLKGTNYIATQWKSNFTKADYASDLQLMRDANINSVRVHAQVESRRFYEAADEAGMLVWQDFPLQWGYEDSKQFQQAAATQLEEMITQLHGHPSIITWSIHNEPPWDADWMKWKYSDYDAGQNAELDDRLYALGKKLDPSRYVHKVSRTQEHQWFGWYSGSIDTFAKPLRESLVTEFGAQALPAKSSLEKIIPPQHIWPESEEAWREWEYRNFQRKESFELARIPKPADLDDFILQTQSYQEELVRFAGATYRARQYEPLGALFQFMFVEDWPSINWGIVDWYRVPKPGYKALKAVYSSVLAVPVLPGRTLQTGTVDVPIRLVSDLWRDIPDVQIIVGLMDGSGASVPGAQRQYSASAYADSTAEIAVWKLSATAGDYQMQVITRAPGFDPVTLKFDIRVEANGDAL